MPAVYMGVANNRLDSGRFPAFVSARPVYWKATCSGSGCAGEIAAVGAAHENGSVYKVGGLDEKRPSRRLGGACAGLGRAGRHGRDSKYCSL